MYTFVSEQMRAVIINGVLTFQEETNVFCGSVDATVVQFSYMAPAANSGWRSWVRSSVLSYHTHDVRASVLADSTLVTGGREALAKFEEINAVVVCESSQVKSVLVTILKSSLTMGTVFYFSFPVLLSVVLVVMEVFCVNFLSSPH